MAVIAQSSEGSADPLLSQVERIFYQRKARYDLIDRDLLGEPGWDIILYAYMAHRKGLICDLESLAAEVDLSFETAKRWVGILVLRKLLVQQKNFVTISDAAEVKLSKMFMEQIRDMRHSFAEAASRLDQKKSSKS